MIAIAITYEEVTALKSMEEANQLVLARLQAAGAPVEGDRNLSLRRGCLVQRNDQEQGCYILEWFPQELKTSLWTGEDVKKVAVWLGAIFIFIFGLFTWLAFHN